MPVLDQSQYQSAEDIAVRVRAILNDLQDDDDLTGDLYSDDRPATWIIMNAAFEVCQDILADNKCAAFTKEAIIPAVPGSSMVDLASQCMITFSGTTQDGITRPTPALPPDLLEPLLIGERLAGTNGRYIPLKPQADGKPFFSGGSLHGTWDWRQDALYLPCIPQSTDLALRYMTYAPSIAGPSSVVYVLRIADALSYMTAARFAESRGSTLASVFEQKAMDALERMYNRDNDRKQRRTYRRRRYGSGRNGYVSLMGSGGTSPLL